MVTGGGRRQVIRLILAASMKAFARQAEATQDATNQQTVSQPKSQTSNLTHTRDPSAALTRALCSSDNMSLPTSTPKLKKKKSPPASTAKLASTTSFRRAELELDQFQRTSSGGQRTEQAGVYVEKMVNRCFVFVYGIFSIINFGEAI